MTTEMTRIIPKLQYNPANRIDINLGNGVKVDPAKVKSMILDPNSDNFKLEMASGDVIQLNGKKVDPYLVQARWNEGKDQLDNSGKLSIYG